MKNINNKGISLILAMGLVILITLLAMTILEYIIPFSRTTKGIEHSSNSYYQTVGAIEDAMWFVSQNNLGNENTTNFPSSATGSSYTIIASGSILPPPGEGNSEYNSNWNIIKSGNPIQLEVGNSNTRDWSNIIFLFRVPDLNGSSNNTTLTLSGGSLPLINRQLSNKTKTLNASGDLILYEYIKDSNNNCPSSGATWDCNVKFTKGIYDDGIDLLGTSTKFATFYNTNCNTSQCILKLSIINKLELTNGTLIPYLEWRGIFDQDGTSGDSIPLRYTKVEAKGKSYGFMKSLEVKIPQQTTIEAFDFTIFQ